MLPSLSAAQTQPDTSSEERYETEAFGHKVVVSTRDGETRISVDGLEMYSDAYLGIDEQLVVNGTGVIIGSSRNGAFACEDAPFIIAFPQGGVPRFDGTVAPCASPVPTMKVSDSDIVFETTALVGQPGKRWRWTPEKGLTLEATIEFSATGNGGWAALEAKAVEHPGSLMDYKDLSQLIRKTVGGDWKKIAPAMDGPGSMDYKGSLAVGTSCEPHACGERQVLVIADIPKRRLYVGLGYPDKGEAFSYPDDRKLWSREASDLLRKWLQGEQ